MKVGILTFQTTANYGACLQCMALTQMINTLGVDCETINYRCANIEKRELATPLFADGLIKAPKQLIWNISKRIKAKKINKFIRDNCRLSVKMYDRSTIDNANDEYDIFLSGSDIIWELYVTGNDQTFYLDFVKDDRKKYSYSSSFGYKKIPGEFLSDVTKLLCSYQRISVRENEGADIVKSVLSKDVKVTLDPTLLFNNSFWNSFEEHVKLDPKKYILLYFDDSEHKAMNYARFLAEREKASVIFLTDGFRKYEGITNIMNVSVGQFLWLIHNALYVVTGSYHGVLFSINYNTPFYYVNRAHQSRINTIVNNLEITGRDITQSEILEHEIDWILINDKLEILRNESIDYLKSIISADH